jgi:hypothetical protein
MTEKPLGRGAHRLRSPARVCALVIRCHLLRAGIPHLNTAAERADREAVDAKTRALVLAILVASIVISAAILLRPQPPDPPQFDANPCANVQSRFAITTPSFCSGGGAGGYTP